MKPKSTYVARTLLRAVVYITIISMSSSAIHAQLGSGWVQYSPTKRIHLDNEDGLQTFTWTSYKSVCSPVCADYSSSNDVETFRLFDNRTNRSEIRLQNEYSSGSRQFEGYVTFYAPLNDESLMQIFGSTSGATQLMIRGYATSGGSMRGGGQTLITGIYGKEVRVNVIHLQENVGNKIMIYINGVKKAEIADNEAVTNYHKYGNYGTLTTDEAIVKWRRARFFRNGTAPSSAAITTSTEAAAARESDYNINVYPNPVTGKQAVIRYTLPKPLPVRIVLFNINGQQQEILNTQQQTGDQTVYWNTAGKPAGVYVARITIGGETKSIRLTLQDR